MSLTPSRQVNFGEYVEIARSTGTSRTYPTIINDLLPTFNSLSEDEKATTIIQTGETGGILSYVGNGMYAYFAKGGNNTSLIGSVMSFNDKKYYGSLNGSAFTENTGTTSNTYIMKRLRV